MTDLGVLCLQELWDPVKRSQVAQGVSAAFPFAAESPQFIGQCLDPECEPQSPSTVQACAENCLDIGGFGDLFDCATGNCPEVLECIEGELRNHWN